MTRRLVIRSFRIGDEAALHEVFRSAVYDVASRHYTPDQIAAWAPLDGDTNRWAERMRRNQPWVVEDEGSIAGFADLQPDGLVDMFFVHGAHGGRGIGRLLMVAIRERAADLGLSSLHAHVSLTAQPFFARFGFRLVEHKTVTIGSVSLANALMRLELAGR